MKWLLNPIIFLLISALESVVASHDAAAEPLFVHLKFQNEDRLEIKMECGELGELKSLETVVNGHVFSVPNEELAKIGKYIQIGNAKVIVRHAGPGKENANKKFGQFVLLVPYGSVTVNLDGESEIHAFDYVAFDFKNGVLQLRRRAISLGDETKRWKLYQKIPGKNEVKDAGVASSAQNPFAYE